jgi:hypothetical protein
MGRCRRAVVRPIAQGKPAGRLGQTLALPPSYSSLAARMREATGRSHQPEGAFSADSIAKRHLMHPMRRRRVESTRARERETGRSAFTARLSGRETDLNHEAAARDAVRGLERVNDRLRMASRGSCSLDFDDERRIEGRVKLVGEIAPWTAGDPRGADAIVEGVIHVAVNLQRRLIGSDQLFQIRREGWSSGSLRRRGVIERGEGA